ncbi:MAG: pyridoxamine 5'-phosphate oxidase family protein [Egibacteraceae bacterium]
MTQEPVADRPFMPGYGVPTEGELLPFSWVEERLADARVYWVATAWPSGQPHLSPVWGVWLQREMVFGCGRQSRKARNLAANPHCSVAPQLAHDAESVVVEGVSRELSPDDDLRVALVRTMKDKYNYDMSAEAAEEPAFAVRPVKVLALDETFNQHATRWTFP